MKNKKILLLAHHGIGDVIMKVPLIRILQKNAGKKNVYITVKNKHIKTAVTTFSNIPSKNCYIYNKTLPTHKKIALILLLRIKRFDYTVIPFNINQNLGRKLGSLIGSKAVIDAESSHSEDHKVIRFLTPFVKKGLLKKTDLTSICNEHYFISLPKQAHSIKLIDVPKIIIHLGSGPIETHKQYPPKKMAKTLDLLTKAFPEIHIALIGSNDEAPINQAIIANMQYKENIIDYTNQLSIPELAILMSHHKSHYMISTDSGPSHLASICKLPIISLFGPTNFELTGPYKGATKVSLSPPLDCMPCYGTKKYGITGCGNNKCMYDISEKTIYTYISQELSKLGQKELRA